METAIYPATFFIAMAVIKVYESLRAKGRPALILWIGPILAICTTLINYLIKYRANNVDNGLMTNAGSFIFSTGILTIAYLIPLVVLLLWDIYKGKPKLEK